MGWATLSAAANRVAFDRLGSVSFTAGAITGRGFLNKESEMELGGEYLFVGEVLIAETDAIGSLRYGDRITVDGNAYKVEHQPKRLEDGTFSKVPLVLIGQASYLTTIGGLRLITQSGRFIVTTAA